MAKVYSAPTDPPQYVHTGNYSDYSNAVDEWVESLQAEARSLVPNNDLVGEVIRFPVADGYAEYMVWNTKPLQLIHLNTGDSYTIPEAHERGLNLADVRKSVQRERALREIFSRKETV